MLHKEAVPPKLLELVKKIQPINGLEHFRDVREVIDNLKKHYLAEQENPVQPLIELTWQAATEKINTCYDLFFSDLKTKKQKQIEERLRKTGELVEKKKSKKKPPGIRK